MSYNTKVQGSFTATGGNVRIPLRAGVTSMSVWNLTQGSTSQTTAVGVKYKWQLEFPDTGAKWVTLKSNAANAANLEQYVTSNGFTLYDSSLQQLGVLQNTITGISNATPPVVTNTGTNGLVAGSVVRLSRVAGGQQLGGIDFTVGYNTISPTTFDLSYMSTIAAATTGSFRVVPYNPIFYPRRRVITSITQATEAVVTTSVTHGYLVGQEVRFLVNSTSGMTEINNLIGTIVAVDTSTTVNSFTVNINSSAFTAFAFPVTSANAFTPAIVVPVGENTAEAISQNVDYLNDATTNRATIGMILQGGINCPGGATDDVMVWEAEYADATFQPAFL